MKKTITILSFLCVISFCFSQSKVLESLDMPSKLLNTTVKYSVYLPDGFDASKEQYPVVYLLNGYTGDETNWVRIGLVKDIVDELIRGNNIEPMVIIMPDGDDSLYMNKDDGSYPYEDMFIKELLPFVEGQYNIKSEKQFRGISGLSMGGAGSLRLALKYHSIFGACAGFSSGILTDEEVINSSQEDFDDYYGRISPSAIGNEGEARLTDAVNEYNIFQLLEKNPLGQLKSVAIYFDCGDDDFLAIGNSMLHIEMTKKRIPHEYRVRDGAHTWNFWVNSLPIGLKFISDTFRN